MFLNKQCINIIYYQEKQEIQIKKEYKFCLKIILKVFFKSNLSFFFFFGHSCPTKTHQSSNFSDYSNILKSSYYLCRLWATYLAITHDLFFTILRNNISFLLKGKIKKKLLKRFCEGKSLVLLLSSSLFFFFILCPLFYLIFFYFPFFLCFLYLF